MKKQELKAICDQMFSDYPDIVTVKQVQKMLGCSRIFVYNRIDWCTAAQKMSSLSVRSI